MEGSRQEGSFLGVLGLGVLGLGVLGLGVLGLGVLGLGVLGLGVLGLGVLGSLPSPAAPSLQRRRSRCEGPRRLLWSRETLAPCCGTG